MVKSTGLQRLTECMPVGINKFFAVKNNNPDFSFFVFTFILLGKNNFLVLSTKPLVI